MTHDTVDELMIGTFAGGVGAMVKLSTLGLGTYSPRISKGSFTVDAAHYSQIATLGDGTEREMGWLQTTWHVNGLKAAQYAALAAYRTAHTTQLYIRTLSEDGATYKNYSCLAHFPPKLNRGDPTAVELGVVFDYEIRFTQMVEVA